MSHNDRALKSSSPAANDAAALLGDFAALLKSLGSPVSPYGAQGIELLATYQASVLIPIELPAIARAASFAARGQLRELVALDASLANEPLLAPFAAGSMQIGRMQLERLRPLRDERLSRRYLAAVESGQARGWHTVVYGIILAVYFWPMRQGLIHYARETMAGLASASGAAGPLGEEAIRAAVEQVIAEQSPAGAQTMSIASP